ncbi:raptor N-terminal caspase like domain-containing protein [Pterulicium gracile]|uniref:Raptor N-terminal caspase like domain-containing protein n=1 Tax=Pterulicium gracile TaxID=1884261 RepID=A0A5C3R0J2_9AGAR|nr:raptor N-terminal caspase like domain-containing protein [Pterula gracilis]
MPPWRGSSPGKLKTANAALVLCLNIDVDPPDVVKTNPCAVLECWFDPRSMPAEKAIEAIGLNLQHQYEQLSLRIAYKNFLDPSYEDLRRFCITLRKQAKEDTVIFHYNGHGVPRPTASGELWCFNRNYTQYIPVSLQELQSWLGSPVVYIWDCSAAGHLLHNFNQFAERRDNEVDMMHGGYPPGTQPFLNSLQLAACAATEQLPTCPELPADVFTSCLTSPIDIALRFYIAHNQLPVNVTVDMVLQVPGDLKDRKTPLGELNWIFTAITDTIAWTTFPRQLFTRLYRSDILIASLFRNFLLAERILKNYGCTPHTYPPLPFTNTHSMWAAWDLAVDTCLRQLPDLLRKHTAPPPQKTGWTLGKVPPMEPQKPYVYIPSRFFMDQLTAFEVWISRGGAALTKRGPMSLPLTNGAEKVGDSETLDDPPVEEEPSKREDLVPRKPPDQLPIVLQVLLCQPHRLRALILLSQFVDLGPWAVHLVLTTGIFPYISRLLLAPNTDLRPVLIFIWARIMAVDSTVQTDLVNSQNYKYFSTILASKDDSSTIALPNPAEHKAMCAFILAGICRDHPAGQVACMDERVLDSCIERFSMEDFLLRQWVILCVGLMWDGNDDIRVYAVDRGVQDALIKMLGDHSVEVRCAVLYALGTFLGASGSTDAKKRGGGGSGTMWQLREREHFRMEVGVGTAAMINSKDDCSPMARKELLVLLSCLVKEWRGHFVITAWIYWEESKKYRTGTHHWTQDEDITAHAVSEWLDSSGDDDYLREENRVLISSFFTTFVALLDLSSDPYPEVASLARTIVDYITALLLESPFAKLEGSTLNVPAPPKPVKPASVRSRAPSLRSTNSFNHTAPNSPTLPRPSFNRADTMTSTISDGVTKTLKRTSSFANALKNLAGGIAFPSTDDMRSASSSQHSSIPQPDSTTSRPPSPNLNVAQYASPYGYAESEYDSLPPPSPSESMSPPTDFLPCDVMEALMEEDMERLRARRRQRSRNSHPQEESMPSPSNSEFSVSSVTLGLGTGSSIQDTLPLKSSYFDWCCEYFKEPQMRQQEQDEPGSTQYNYQVWRQQRNEQVCSDTQSQLSAARTSRWDKPVVNLQVPGIPLNMAFHSYDQHVFIANDSDVVSVWDWSQKRRLCQFHNGNAPGSAITSLSVINEEVGGMIMTGTSEGIVRLYRNYDPALDQGPLQLVSAFKGLNDLIQVKQGSGMVIDWKQAGGTLTVGGDSQIIRIWEANTEAIIMEIPTQADSPVTQITSLPLSNSLILASFANGDIKLFDRRMTYEDALCHTLSDHSTWVHGVRVVPNNYSQCVSASMDGQVKLWDIRKPEMLQSWNVMPHGISAFDVHSQANVFACASAISPGDWRSQRIAVQAIDEDAPLSTSTLATGLTGQSVKSMPSPYVPRMNSVVFHPLEMLYAAGEPDGSVRIMGCNLVSSLPNI